MSKKKEQIVNKIHALYKQCNDSNRQKFLKEGQSCEEFFLGEQLSKDELLYLRNAGMPDFVVNKITPAVEMMVYFATAKNPTWKAVPVDGTDSEIATVFNTLAQYCWNKSKGQFLFSQTVKEALKRGHGFLEVDVDADSDRGLGDVTFNHLKAEEVFVDPKAKGALYEDAEYIGIHKTLTRQHLMSAFPHKKSVIERLGSGGSTIDVFDLVTSDRIVTKQEVVDGVNSDGEREIPIDYYKVYFKTKLKKVHVFYRRPRNEKNQTILMERIKKAVKKLEKEITVEIKEKILAIQKQAEAGQIIPERAELEIEKIHEETSKMLEQKKQMIGHSLTQSYYKVESKVLLVDEYKELEKQGIIERTLGEITDEVEFYDSVVRCVIVAGNELLGEFTFGDEVKDIPIVPIIYLHNGNPFPVSFISMLKGKQQEINKGHQLAIHNANLGSNLRWLAEKGSIDVEEWEQYSSSAGAILEYNPGKDKPDIVRPEAINNAFFTFVMEGKKDIEDLSGMRSAQQGDKQQGQETYRGMLIQDEYGTRRVRQWISTMVEPALERLGKIFHQFARMVYSTHRVLRIVQPDTSKIKSLELNVPVYNEYGEVVKTAMNYPEAQFDIMIKAGGTLPVNRWAILQEYKEWFNAGIIDDIAFLAETDIKNKDLIIKRKSMIAQLKQKLASFEDRMKHLNDQNKTLQRQIVQDNIQKETMVRSAEMNREFDQSKAQQKLLRDVRQNEIDKFRKDLKLLVKEVKLDLKKNSKSGEEK